MGNTVVSITGAIMAFIGVTIIISNLDVPAIFAYQGMILGAVFLGLGIVVMAISELDGRGRTSLYFCGHCKFAASQFADLYNHSVKEHDDDLGYGNKDTAEPRVRKQKQKRNLRKSPTAKGTLIGVVAVFILMSIFYSVGTSSFVMMGMAMSPTIKQWDIMHFTVTPVNEIKINDIIIYENLDKNWVQKVTQVNKDSSGNLIFKTKNETSPTIHTVYENQYIGEMDYVIGNGGELLPVIIRPPLNFIFLIAVFVIPIIIIRKRAKNPK